MYTLATISLFRILVNFCSLNHHLFDERHHRESLSSGSGMSDWQGNPTECHCIDYESQEDIICYILHMNHIFPTSSRKYESPINLQLTVISQSSVKICDLKIEINPFNVKITEGNHNRESYRQSSSYYQLLLYQIMSHMLINSI